MNAKVLFLTKYSDLGASSRLRTLQYLKDFSFEFRWSPLFNNDYIIALYEKNFNYINVIRSYGKRISVLFKNDVGLLYIEKELFPYMPYFIEHLFLRNKKYILDFDDAIFHNYDDHNYGIVRVLFSSKIALLIKNAELVIVGNEYLRDYAVRSSAKKVIIIPTSVDLEKYLYNSKDVNNDVFTIGWIGSPSTQSYLGIIHDALKSISKIYNVKLRVIGIQRYTIEGVNVECEEWSELHETKQLSEIDLGVMPLPNNPFERGKCGYKIIQYGASHKPSIASPVGVNKQIISNGLNGYLADTTEDWIAYMGKLINDKALRSQLGLNARIHVEKNYSLQINGKILEDVILSVV